MAMKRVPSNTTLPEPLKLVAQDYCDRIGKTLTALQQELLETRLKSEGIDPYPKLQPVAREASADRSISKPAKRKIGALVDRRYVTMSILGTSPCGRFAFSEQTVLGRAHILRTKYKPGAFGIYASGDSMNLAKLPDGSKGINDGDVLICRSLEYERADEGKIVVALGRGETCVKRLGPHGVLVPESTNETHTAKVMGKDSVVQAVVIGKL